jgi:hypothetical protein
MFCRKDDHLFLIENRPAIGTMVGSNLRFGRGIVWCSIQPNAIYILMNYIPLVFGGIASIILTIKTLRLIRQESEVSEYKKVVIYPLIQFISVIPALAERLNDLATGQLNFTLFLIYVVASRSQGIINALFWGRSILKELKQGSIGHSSFTPGDPTFIRYDTSTIYQNVSLVTEEKKN